MATSKKTTKTTENVKEITQEGYDSLVEELERLKKKLPEITDKIQLARQDGDLSENAPYHAAREEKGFAQGRIEEIEAILKTCVVAGNAKKNIVGVGTKVILTNLDNKMVLNVTVVGENEADFASGKLSCESVIGKAIMGKKTGTTVTVNTPKGETKYQVEISK